MNQLNGKILIDYPMKKKFYTFLIIFINNITVNAQDISSSFWGWKPDRIYKERIHQDHRNIHNKQAKSPSFNINTISEYYNMTYMYINEDSIIYTYDNHGRVLSVLDLELSYGTWQFNYIILNSYDSYGNLINDSLLYSNLHYGMDSYTRDFTYDTNGNLLTEITQRYNNYYLYCWQVDNRLTYTYDTNGYLLMEFTEGWDSQNSLWKNSYMYTYTNDLNGNVLIYLTELWNSQNNGWVYNQRYTYTYDTNDSL